MGQDGGKRMLFGFPLGVVLMLWHSTTLGIDYTIWISTAPAYFADILNHSGEFINASDDLLDNATAGFSVAQSVWAGGQLLGCLACAPLPRLMGYRWAFVMLVFLSCFGNVLYSVAGIIGGVSGEYIAWIGKALDGFGDGSVALGLGFIPIAMFGDRKRMVTAMINYRGLMALGMMLGAAVSMGLDNVDIPQAVGSDGVAREFSGGDLVGWAQACIYFPSLFLGCCALDNSKPPVAKGKGGKGSVCTPYFTQKSVFWLFLVFSYGLTGSLATYFLPVFPYISSDLTSAQYIGFVTLGAFAAGFLGALFNSVVSVMKRCNINGLPLLRAACILITASMALMYGGYRTFTTNCTFSDDSVDEGTPYCSGQILFIVGVCLYFLSSTSLSAGMAPVFKEVIPKTSLSAMMPLYKICLDGGKIIGPLYSDWATTESSDVWETAADIAFSPSLAMYVLITLTIFIGGGYLSTPDFKPSGGDKKKETVSAPHPAPCLATFCARAHVCVCVCVCVSPRATLSVVPSLHVLTGCVGVVATEGRAAGSRNALLCVWCKRATSCSQHIREPRRRPKWSYPAVQGACPRCVHSS